ncbi:AAA family ATPase [Mesorhizobium sp. M7A.F.Ca.US.014.04.1.1]|uniref:ATP-binding protein n=3 Tax=Phyllobacteriaceae TaxID=69277 RepID=UPI0007A95548|nr:MULTISPECIES: ATP-binding protein [Mesorhizobium]AMX94020.1 hypothetical protein A4R28_13395 [Mesorhizobium ciceri]MBZ9722021.1 ATP-binding protein [Mesorhizobium sp. AD1-1]MDF3208760.1 ATP-binding protein [Mesorhizobium sp. LMG15046]MDF3228669.1 ATP-binding protein [Mesorhizobium sp. DSM 30133]RUU19120.1 AAA family ATPase [Mesorhizobium sp. Primo-B]
MHTLESYLSDGIQRDREDIAAIDRVLLETGETIAGTFNSEKPNWPYEIPDRRKENDKHKISHSTMTMMIRAIDLLRESQRVGTSRPGYAFEVGGQYAKKLDEARKKAFDRLVAELREARSETRAQTITTISPTYGTNDPLTMSFLAEVLSATPGGTDDLMADARIVVQKLVKIDPTNSFVSFFIFKNRGLTESKVVPNAFVPLLVVRAAHTLGQEIEGRAAYLRYFESTLHDQLSYSNIPDSRFDPAELIFSLEGVLLLSEQTIDVRLFDRVLDVLEQAQQTSAHWRPSKPFLRTVKGFVLFPISVEAANSLLRCCQRLDKDERFHGRSERYIALFRRFWSWLAARRVTIDVEGTPRRVSGWHSDHVADPDSIQLWDTAQVVDFLLGYRRSLHGHIARTTLRLSRFNVRKPQRAKQSWSPATQAMQLARKTTTAAAPDDKADLRESFEPITSLGPYFETYRKVEEEFLLPWLGGSPRNYSMLIYGPPGTGKTSVAENLADALGFPLVTITVSDFLAGGGGEVEARAKMIFEVLEAQADVVVLFDEIDELVLDRSSKRHGQQDTVFKFMTPGMLTKFNNLRRAKRGIFIMATNYAYRIDPAIRRTGRIDENYLLLPPDATSRQKMIKNFLKDAIEKGNLPADHALNPDNIEKSGKWSILRSASFFLGYKDIEAAVARVVRQVGNSQSVTELESEFLEWGRTTTLRLYNGAFDEIDDREAIEREFLPLIEMAAREGAVLKEKKNPALDCAALFKADEKNGKLASFASELKLREESLRFVKRRSPEYVRK